MDVLPEELSGEEAEGHDDGPEDGRASLDEQGVEDEAGDEDPVGSPLRDPDQLEERKEQKRDDGDVGAGDGEQMVESRLLQGEDHVRVHAAVVAEEQGLEDRALGGDPRRQGAGEIALELLLESLAEDGDGLEHGGLVPGARPLDEQGALGEGAVMDALALEVAGVEGALKLLNSLDA